MKRFGFTLAEVLITLGVIGVVAALTLPSIIQKYTERATIVKVKKTYSVISNAFLMAKNEYGSFTDWGVAGHMSNSNTHTQFANMMKEYMNVAVDCTVLENDDLVKKECLVYEAHKKTVSAALRLKDGSLITFRVFWPNCDAAPGYIGSTPPLSETCGSIRVYYDSKNIKSGVNSFSFFITKNAIVPYGTKDINSQIAFERSCNKNIMSPFPNFDNNTNMYGCTAWVLENENMDYLRCPGKLSWDGAHTCKEAKR